MTSTQLAEYIETSVKEDDDMGLSDILEQSAAKAVVGSAPVLAVMPGDLKELNEVIEVDDTQRNAIKPKSQALVDQTNLLPTKQLLIVFSGLSLAMCCGMLESTIVTTALPVLGKIFDSGQISSWIGASYLLTATVFQPLYGRFSDIFGRKGILLFSLGLFFVGSLLCATAQTMITLIVFRAVQGIGGGGMITMVMIVISDVVSMRERGKYQALIGSMSSLASAVGPLAGGLLTEDVSWRWCFYINLPLSGLAFIVAILFLPLRHVGGDIMSKLRRVDYLGSALVFASTTLVLLAISWGGTIYQWDSAASIVPIVAGFVLFVIFIVVEVRFSKLPVMPMNVFKNAHVSTCVFCTFISGFASYVNLYYLPQFYQVVRQDSPASSGIMVLPIVVSQTCLSYAAGFFISWTGRYKECLWIGFALWTIASGLLSTVTLDTSNAKLVVYQLLSGFGSGPTLQTTLIACQAAVERHEMGTITSTRNFLRMIGSTLAVTICAAILNNVVRIKLSAAGVASELILSILADPTAIRNIGLTDDEADLAINAYLRGVQCIYYMMIGLCAIQFLSVVIFVKQYSLTRADDALQKEAAKARLEEAKGRKVDKQGV